VTSPHFQKDWEPAFEGEPTHNEVLLTAVPCDGFTFSHWEYDNGSGWTDPEPSDLLGQDGISLRVFMSWKDGSGIRLPGYDPETNEPGQGTMRVRAVFVPIDPVRVILIHGWDINNTACSEGVGVGGGMDELFQMIPNSLGCTTIEKRIYRENCVDSKDLASAGRGMVFDDILDAYFNDGIRKFALIGYSRGGGSVADLAHRLANPAPLDPHYPPGSLPDLEIVFTGYIDAVVTGEFHSHIPNLLQALATQNLPAIIEIFGQFDWSPELRRPSLSLRHANLFQEHSEYFCGPVAWENIAIGNKFRGNISRAYPKTCSGCRVV
jgi:hypothetical protein